VIYPTQEQSAKLLDLLVEVFGERDGVDVVEVIRETLITQIEDVGNSGPTDQDERVEYTEFLSGAWLLFDKAHDEHEKRNAPMPIADAIAHLDEIDV
jgi:hypothetical protein